MAIDSSIYSNIGRGVKSVADYENEAATSRQNKLAEIMDGMKMDEARRGIADDAAVRQAYQQSGGDQNKLLQNLQNGGQYKAGQALQKTLLENQKTQSDIALATAHAGKFGADTQTANYDLQTKKHDDAIKELTGFDTPQQAIESVRRHASSGALAPDQAQAALQSIPQDPTQFASWQMGKLRNLLSAKDQIAQISPDANAVLSAKTSTNINAANIANSDQIAQMVDDRKRDELQGAQEAFSPDAIKNAASRYNIDGTLPPMGMGKAGSAGRAAILNEAAIQAGASGISGDDQRIAQIGNKANTAALSKIQQSQTMVGAFEKNFTRNADIALEESKKVDGTGVPLVNKWLNAGKRSVTGDAQLAAYDAVIKSTSNEYAKIVSGSMGNTAIAEGEIKKIEALLNSAQTPQQVEAVINMMKRETANRMAGFEEEKAALRNSMKSTPAAPSARQTPQANPSGLEAEMRKRGLLK